MTKMEHLLTCLMEECAEIQQAASKILRFGLHDRYPSELSPDNQERLRAEILDLYTIIDMIEDFAVVPPISYADFNKHKREKRDKVSRYLGYARECGTLIAESEAAKNEPAYPRD